MFTVPEQSALDTSRLAVPLPVYASVIGISECGLYGVNNPDDWQRSCKTIWSKPDRDSIQRYLSEAQIEIEDKMKYFIRPTWVVGKLDDAENRDARFVDNQKYTGINIRTRWAMVIAGGVKGTTTIEAGAAVDHTADPAEIVVATTVTDESEIVVYHPGTQSEIFPSSIVISGGNATIKIPRCRMVKASLDGNDPDVGLDYTVVANFEATVDVVRVYNDRSTNAEIVWPHSCTATCSLYGCNETTKDACITVKKDRLGLIDAIPATYSGGSWSMYVDESCCRGASEVRLNYYCGVFANKKAQDAVIRLAHSKMPHEPCGCDITRNVWKRDRNVPDVLTRERMNCDFGMSDGAWIAWQFASSSSIVRGGKSL